MLLLLSRLICALPSSWARALARGVAFIWYHFLPLRRRTARRNVARALGPTVPAAVQHQIVRDSFTHLCHYAVEGLRMPALTRARSEATVERHNMAQIDALLARGRGIVAVTAHLGNFDLLGTSQTVRGYPVHAIVKDIKWRAADAFWQAVRRATGLGCVAPRGSRQTIAQLLDKNQIVAFLVDQHLPPHRAIVCEFMGQLAATTPFPVRIAMQTGAPVLPLYIVRLPHGRHRIVVEAEFVLEHPYADQEQNVRHNTERLNRRVEAWVRAHPEQWLWQHRRWKVQDSPEGWHIPEALQHLRHNSKELR